MKITDVKAYVIETPTPKRFRWRDGHPGPGPIQEHCWLRVITDEGLEGWAHSGRGYVVADLVRRRIKDLAIGYDPLLKEEVWHRTWDVDRIEEFPIYVLGLLDVALWDITAQAAGLPLYKILGGARDKIPAYASTVTWETVEEYLGNCEQCLTAGYPAIKLHSWGRYREDAKLALALRKHLGDEVPLMSDGSAAFRYEEALYVGQCLEEVGFLWFEEPMIEFNIGQYRRLCRDLKIPILAPETSDGCHYNVADFIAQDAVDIIRTSCQDKGGVTGALRVAHLADAFGMYAEIHGGGLPNLHLACAIENTRYFEVLVIEDAVVEREGHGELAIDKDGCVHVPQRPGIGWQIDLKDLEANAKLVV